MPPEESYDLFQLDLAYKHNIQVLLEKLVKANFGPNGLNGLPLKFKLTE